MMFFFISLFVFMMYNMTRCPTIFHIWANYPLRNSRYLGARCCRVCGKSQLADRSGEMGSIFTHRPGLDGMHNMASFVQHEMNRDLPVIRIDPATQPFKPRIVKGSK